MKHLRRFESMEYIVDFPILKKIVPDGEWSFWHIINKIDTLSIIEKLLLDIEMHYRSIQRGEHIKHNMNAIDEKKKVINVIEGKSRSMKDIDEALKILEDGKNSHDLKWKRRYDRKWDITWLKVYDEWIDEVKKIKMEHSNQM